MFRLHQLNMNTAIMTYALCIFVILLLDRAQGHGMLIDPANRASRWRYGFTGPNQYTDNQLSCGGRNVQWNTHGGKCGACGDEYNIASPKYTYPGSFATNPPIVKTYNAGQQIEVKVKITANHKGYFTFRVAPLNNPPITQEDLDNIMLELPNGDAEWQLTTGHGTGVFTITLQLPMSLSCDHCVMQWWWTTGNNYNNDKPETFVNCADITILPADGNQASTTSEPQPQTNPVSSTGTCPPCNCPAPTPCRTAQPPATQPPVTQVTPPPVTQPPVTQPPATQPPATTTTSPQSGCYSIYVTATDQWCINNCAMGYCPSSMCACN